MPYDGRFVALEGEVGIGKTRLAEEFLARVRSDGGLIIDARCYEGQANLAYGPFVEGLRALDLPARAREWHARISPQGLAEAARLLPELDALGPLPPLLPLEGPGGQARFLESLSQLLLALCSEQACSVLFVDDLQWIDDASLDLLTYLVRRLRGRSLFILGAWRKEEVAADSRLRQLLAESERAGTGALISLERLNRPAVAELVQAALPASSAPELADRLYRESEGQPFILVEYLALLSGDQRQAGEWSLPGSVRSVLRSRLARLSETARQLLSTAAVIGRSFDYDTLLEASGRSAEETVTGLEELLSQGIIQEVSGGPNGNAPVLDLTHDKLRALVYEETSLVRRRLLHRRVAESLANYARLHHETERLAARIAGHFQQAGEEREAAEYFRMGGDYARSLYANGEALLHYRSALALGHPDAASLHESIGDLQTLSGEYGGALHSYEMAQLLGDGKRTGEIDGKTAGVHARRGDWALAERHFEAALSALGSSPSSRACARIYGDRSLVALKSGDPERALGLARQALELAEQAQDRPAVAQAHNILGVLARHLGDTAEAADHLEQSISLGDSLDDPAIRSAALNNLALVARDRGSIADGLDFARQALTSSKTLGDRHREAAVHNNLADLYHAVGREDEAMAHLKEAVTIYAEIGGESGTWQPEIWKLAEW